MDGLHTTSVSKGCFTFKTDIKRENVDPTKFLKSNTLRSIDRWKSGQDIWIEIQSAVLNVNKSLQKVIFSDLISFIEKSFTRNKQRWEKHAEIPTAAVITGVNMPDHSALFEQLREKVQEKIAHRAVLLHSKDCPNIKSMLRTVANQLFTGRFNQEKDMHNNLHDGSNYNKKSMVVTLSLIKKWYNEEKANMKPIVVMCVDFESFSHTILHDFILMCSFHAATLPLLFVFGIATSWSDVFQRLTHSSILNLSVERFQAPTATEHLALLVDKILLTTEYPFKISGKCLQLVLDIFLCHDFSITNFLHALKFCIFEHFYEQPASILCSNSLEKSLHIISNLTKNEIRTLKSVESFKKYIASHNCDLQRAVLNDKEFKIESAKCLQRIHTFHSFYFPTLQCLYCLTSALPQHPLGKKFREIYCICYRSDISKHEGYKQAFTFLKVSSRRQLIERFGKCASVLQSFCYNYDANFEDKYHPLNVSERLQSFVTCLSNMDETDEQSESEEQQRGSQEEQVESVKYAYQLQERLRRRANEKRKRKMTKFERIRESSLAFLKAFFEQHLQRVQFMPFYEAFYFDSTSALKHHLVAAPRLAIQTALSSPQQYLQTNSLKSNLPVVMSPNTLDICVVYKLHNECGSIINLYDWMSAFHVIVNSGNGNSNSETNSNNPTEEIDEITQARFVRAVSELQHLGFIKTTKKKTDHVQRLTWSHS